MDLSKISKGAMIWAGAGIVYLISTFLDWYAVDESEFFFSVSANGWDVGFLWGGLWAILGIAGAVVLVLPALGVAGPKLPAVAFLAIGALATLFTLLKLIIGEDDPWSTSFGLYLAVIAAIGMAAGGFLMFQESGGSIDDLTDMNKLKNSFGGSGGGSTPPPPPPPPGMTPPPPPPPAG